MPDNRLLTTPSAPFFSSLPPVYAAFFRGLTGAVIVGAIEAVIHYLDTSQTLPPNVAIVAPLLVLLLRSAEGAYDHHSTGATTPAATTAALDGGRVTVSVRPADAPYKVETPAPPTVDEVIAAAQPKPDAGRGA